MLLQRSKIQFPTPTAPCNSSTRETDTVLASLDNMTQMLHKYTFANTHTHIGTQLLNKQKHGTKVKTKDTERLIAKIQSTCFILSSKFTVPFTRNKCGWTHKGTKKRALCQKNAYKVSPNFMRKEVLQRGHCPHEEETWHM